MTFAPKVILHCPGGCHMELDSLVEQFLASGVKFVGVVGGDCERVENIIDEIVVGDGSDPRRFLLTTAHPGESLAEAVAFAESLFGEYSGEVQVVDF